jgi:hypothetical protein
MPPLNDLLAQVSFLAAMPAVVGVLATAGVLVISRNWRLNLAALAVQYFLVVLLLTRLIRLEVAAVKGLTGWLICTVFYLTERQMNVAESTAEGQDVGEESGLRRWMMSARSAFYLLVVLLMAVVAYAFAARISLPEVPTDITLASYLLTGLGILMLGVSDDALRVGLGLLTFISGFDLFYVALEPSLVVAGLLSLISFLISLAMTYLRAAQVTAQDKGVTA